MSAKFSSAVNGSQYIDPSNKKQFFGEDTLEIDRQEKREIPPTGNPREQCKENLFFGFFHDGTRNSLGESLINKDRAETNVARLYRAYPGNSVAGVLPTEADWTYKIHDFSNYFRVYTPGVGSKFPQVNDSGKGLDATFGAAAGYLGERRIIWTLAQAINNVHRYFLKNSLIDAEEILRVSRKISLTAYDLQHIEEEGFRHDFDGGQQTPTPRDEFKKWLKKLHAAIRLHMPVAAGGDPENIDPGIVKEIYVSVFGFSRGAASARVFTNWLMALCRLDAQMLGKPGMTLGGFPVNVDFIGLFDTVASVGLANTIGYFQGHDAWCDAKVSLRIPDEVTCLHLVSAHDVRRSFPLDSISVNNITPQNHEEVAYPGMHSDLGGGYKPREQGKGLDATGKDMLSRLPLAHMYRAARLAGVPLRLEAAPQQVKEDFMIAPATIEAFNRYVRLTDESKRAGTLTEIMRDQRRYYIQWRMARRTAALEGLASFGRARPEEQNELRSANEDFEEEIQKLASWLKERETQAAAATETGAAAEAPAPGFNNSSRDSEWEEVATYWNQKLPDGMAPLFDDYAHDSRAGFKLSGPEAHEVEGVLQDWVKIKNQYASAPRIDGFDLNPLTPDQLKYANEYERTKIIPKMPSSGREVLNGAGYLRYRRIYAGGNRMLISRSQPAGQTQTAGNTLITRETVPA